MAIQIIGYREYFNEREKRVKLAEKFYDRGWRAESVRDILADPDKYLTQIPAEEQYNLHYTVAHCFEQKGRVLQSQEVIPFDIDHIDVDRITQYIEPVALALNISQASMGVVSSGHGVHFLVGITEPIEDEEHFDTYRPHYALLCANINRHLLRRGLPGEADRNVWSTARTLRFPGTINRKAGQPDVESYVVVPMGDAVVKNIVTLANIPELSSKDSISPQALKRFPKPDTKGVLEGCEFLKWTKENPQKVKEPEWYAMLSILGHLEHGRDLAHSYSKGNKGYTRDETDSKLDQALLASGPRTCANICGLWDGCKQCPHWTQIKSPVQIKSLGYIKTQETGFHEVTIDKSGIPKVGKPAYEDLRRFFEKQHAYVTMEDSQIIYTWQQTHWVAYPDARVTEFAQRHFVPLSDVSKRREFLQLVLCTNLRNADFFNNSSHLINFKNGVLDLATMVLSPHSPQYAFKYVLPYDYNPAATCPLFEDFMKDVTLGDRKLQNILLEYAGYCFSNEDPSWGEKALILLGEGSNGKSVFMDVLKNLAGKDNYSSLTLMDVQNEANRYQLDGKLFNLAEETPNRALLESSLFKNLTTGGETMVRMLYKQPFRIKNMTKLLFACNKLPKATDSTHAMFRRLIVVPFHATFDGKTKDKGMRKKLYTELPGIFNKVIEGYHRLRAQGEFSDSELVRKEIEDYRLETDTVAAWWYENVTLHDVREAASAMSMDKLFGDYVYFCESRKIVPVDYNALCKQLRIILPAESRYKRVQEEGKRYSAIIGVSLTKKEGVL